MANYTAEELAVAKSVDLTAVAAGLGYTVKRVGKYHTLQEMDSIRIYNRTHWFRWSRQYEKGENGGSQIDFLRVFAGMEVKEAVFWLLDFTGYRRNEDIGRKTIAAYRVEKAKEQKKPFILPAPAASNDSLYSYLMEERGISKEVIDYFVKKELIYQEGLHRNIVFKGNDKNGNTRFASMRGVSGRDGKGFRCDVAGSDKNYGFSVFNEGSDELLIFEAGIDLMSHQEICHDFETNKLALGMLSDAPAATFLKEHPQVGRIRFCIDNDEPGRKAARTLKEKYAGLGYEVFDCPPPMPYRAGSKTPNTAYLLAFI